MEYVLVEWRHELEDEPTSIYSELDQARREVRKVEVYRSGISLLYEEGNPGLADVPFPERLGGIDRAGPFRARAIQRERFEEAWDRARETPGDPFHLLF